MILISLGRRLRSVRRLIVAPILLATVVGCAPHRQKLTYDAVYGPDRIRFSNDYVRVHRWLPDGEHYLEYRGGRLHRINSNTGAATPAYDFERVATNLRRELSITAEDADDLAAGPLVLSDDLTVAVFEHGQRLYAYDFAVDQLRPLSTNTLDRRALTLDPTHRQAAFVHDNDLYTVALDNGLQRRLTHGGTDTLLNGILDWVYQEEVFGRGNWRGYWWSEDGQRLAYLQLDVANVPTYPIVDWMPTRAALELQRYPKAGDPNPRVRLGIVPAAGGATTWVDLGRYANDDIIIVAVDWSPSGRLYFTVQDREGTWLELNVADPTSGGSRLVLRETTEAWVSSYGPPHWLDDDTFLWMSARDGWRHLYHYTADGKLIRRLTRGEWEVRELHGADIAAEYIYFSGTRDSHIETHAYRVPLAGGDVERLTTPGFSHEVQFAPDCARFVDSYSSLSTPPRVQLCDPDGTVRRVLSADDMSAEAAAAYIEPEVLRIPTPFGYGLNATLLRPPGSTRLTRLPVVVYTYGGPHGPVVHNRWPGRHGSFWQLLAHSGYLVWHVDPHSASGEGDISAWHCYQRLGETELADIEASLRWLARHENADLDRVAIMGASYGGFVVAYAMTHSTIFKAGIADASVTDWRNYDSIYTERFMRTPANNPVGYAQSSAVAAAADLHGRLLIVHGGLDNNVHLQNAMQLIDALGTAKKQFDLMIYPIDKHGPPNYSEHERRLKFEFIREHL